MNIRIWTGATLGAGGLVMCAPIVLPPDPIYPSLLSFLPYATLFASSCMIKSRSEATVLLAVSLVVVLLGSFIYLDTLRFNIIFSWQISGLVTSFLPWFQLTACLPVAVWLIVRDERIRRVSKESVVLQQGGKESGGASNLADADGGVANIAGQDVIEKSDSKRKD